MYVLNHLVENQTNGYVITRSEIFDSIDDASKVMENRVSEIINLEAENVGNGGKIVEKSVNDVPVYVKITFDESVETLAK